MYRDLPTRHIRNTNTEVGPENLVAVIGEENGLLGVKGTYVQGQFNTPLQQRLFDAGFSTQQVASVGEGNPATIEQLVDVREGRAAGRCGRQGAPRYHTHTRA